MNSLDLDLISKCSHGHENKYITDKLDYFSKMDAEIYKNLSYVKTQYCEQEYKKGSITFRLDADNTRYEPYTEQLFIRNIRISGIKLTNYEFIDLEIGGSIVNRIPIRIYNVIKKRHGLDASDKLVIDLGRHIKEMYILKEILDDNTIILPYYILPHTYFNHTKIILETTEDSPKKDAKIRVSYGIYSYDTTKTNENIESDDDYYLFPTTIIDNPSAKGFIKKSVKAFKCQHLIEQIQYSQRSYIVGPVVYSIHTFRHIVTCIAINVPKEIENDVFISFCNLSQIRLPFSYRVDSFAVYEFPWLNFSRMDNINLHMILPDNQNPYNIEIYAFNKNILKYSAGMCDLRFI
jgi:hypothetical protein